MVTNSYVHVSMQHLYAKHPKNRHVTTITFETLLQPVNPNEFVTESMFRYACNSISKETTVSCKGFKNSYQLTLHVTSTRLKAASRKVSVKVFKNLRLHITGTHSIDMVDHVVEHVRSWLQQFTTELREEKSARRVDVVLYKYQLPSNVNMMSLQKTLQENGILAIYDPSTYAGVRVKIPVYDDKQASVMIFRSGKVIIILPRQTNFDDSLEYVCKQIDTHIIDKWKQMQLTNEPSS